MKPWGRALAAARLGMLCAGALAACAARQPVPVPLPPSAAASNPGGNPAGDAGDDWHVLLPAPFGTLLKDYPGALHEVLLFRDTAGAADADSAGDCYAAEGAAPRWLGQEPEQHLICFGHDRLRRIEATVRLPADRAAATFGRACAGWLRHPAATSADTCTGGDGAVAFNAILHDAPGGESSTVSITLTGAAPAAGPKGLPDGRR